MKNKRFRGLSVSAALLCASLARAQDARLNGPNEAAVAESAVKFDGVMPGAGGAQTAVVAASSGMKQSLALTQLAEGQPHSPPPSAPVDVPKKGFEDTYINHLRNDNLGQRAMKSVVCLVGGVPMGFIMGVAGGYQKFWLPGAIVGAVIGTIAGAIAGVIGFFYGGMPKEGE